MTKLIGEHIKAVVFDFDDTLIGTHVATWNLHRHIAKKHYSVELTDELLRAHWGRPLQHLARHYYGTDNIEEAIQLMVDYQADFPKEKFHHAESTLKRLKASGRLLGIVSATTLPILKKDAELAELPIDLMDYIQTGEDTEFHKPDPRVFEPMLGWAALKSIAAEEVLYVGDGLQDLKAARGAGLNFIGVATGLVTVEEFTGHGSPSVADIAEL